MSYQIGMVGLGVMGRNLAQNLERNGHRVAGFDLDPEQRSRGEQAFAGKQIKVFDNLKEFTEALESPKRIMTMVPAGRAVDEVIHDLKAYLSTGDVLIDGGNSYFVSSTARTKELAADGILFIGAGVSGGEMGALWGPSLMPGGNPAAWPLVKPVFQSIAARADDGIPCCDWVGSDGAGHFVKMIHNGIEYGDMQMISEAYFLLEQVMGLPRTRWRTSSTSGISVNSTATWLRSRPRSSARRTPRRAGR